MHPSLPCPQHWHVITRLLDVPAGSSEAAAAFWGSQELRDSVCHAKTAFCIHNLAYQGFMPLATFPRLCLPEIALRPLLWPPLASEGERETSCACYSFAFDCFGLSQLHNHTHTEVQHIEGGRQRQSLPDDDDTDLHTAIGRLSSAFHCGPCGFSGCL